MLAISFTFHIVGIVFWVGGLMFLTRFLKLIDEQRLNDEALVRSARISFIGFVVPGCAFVLASGLFQLLNRGFSFYMKQGWFHGKLTAVILLLVVTAVVGMELQKAVSGRVPSRARIGICHGLASAVLVAVVALTYIGRGV